MKWRREAFITVEAAVVLGTYLVILGTFISVGIELYEKSDKEVHEVANLKSVEDICERRRQIELLRNL